MDIKNISPLGDLIIPVLGLEVAAGAVVTITDETVAASLLEQSDNWVVAKTPKTSPAAPVDPVPTA